MVIAVETNASLLLCIYTVIPLSFEKGNIQTSDEETKRHTEQYIKTIWTVALEIATGEETQLNLL